MEKTNTLYVHKPGHPISYSWKPTKPRQIQSLEGAASRGDKNPGSDAYHSMCSIASAPFQQFLLCRPGAAADLSLRLFMYLRTQCRNEGLKMKIHKNRAAPVVQQFSTACSPGCDPGDRGWSPTHWAPCMEPASPSACASAFLSLPLPPSLSVMNKQIKS